MDRVVDALLRIVSFPNPSSQTAPSLGRTVRVRTFGIHRYSKPPFNTCGQIFLSVQKRNRKPPPTEIYQ